MSGADETSKGLVSKMRQNVDSKSAVALIIIIMIYSPCLAAMGTFYAEVPQLVWKVFYTIYPNVVAWLLAFGVYRVLALMGY